MLVTALPALTNIHISHSGVACRVSVHIQYPIARAGLNPHNSPSAETMKWGPCRRLATGHCLRQWLCTLPQHDAYA